MEELPTMGRQYGTTAELQYGKYSAGTFPMEQGTVLKKKIQEDDG